MLTNAAPQKILQHMLVGVNGRLLMICISTLSNLTVIDRSTAETLKECQLRLSGATRASAKTSALFALMDAQPTSCARSTSRRRGETLGRARLV